MHHNKATLGRFSLALLTWISAQLCKWNFKVNEFKTKLESEAGSTLEYVNVLTFLDEIQTRIEPIEEQSNIVTGMYELMEKFQVPAPPEDLALFQTLRPAVVDCRTSIDKGKKINKLIMGEPYL